MARAAGRLILLFACCRRPRSQENKNAAQAAIVGRSSNYTVRRRYDIKHGFRAGAFAALMKDVVAKLEEEDMLAIAAYLASQAP